MTIDQLKKYAVRYAKNGLFPSVFAAQSILETGVLGGGSELANKYNNLLGIKADSSWQGDTVRLKTAEYSGIAGWVNIYDEFRVYDSPEDSFADRVQFLVENPRYTEVFEKETPEAQAQALQDSGYATDPEYADKLINVIERYNLYELDKTKKNMRTANLTILLAGAVILVAAIYLIIKQN